MDSKFTFTDLVLFHKIYNGESVIKLPQYLSPITNEQRSRLRSNTNRPDRLNADLSELPDFSSRRNNRFDRMSLTCVIEAKARSFKSGFFFRTHLAWNELPSVLKRLTVSDAFQASLKRHLWDRVMQPPWVDNETPDSTLMIVTISNLMNVTITAPADSTITITKQLVLV